MGVRRICRIAGHYSIDCGAVKEALSRTVSSRLLADLPACRRRCVRPCERTRVTCSSGNLPSLPIHSLAIALLRLPRHLPWIAFHVKHGADRPPQHVRTPVKCLARASSEAAAASSLVRRYLQIYRRSESRRGSHVRLTPRTQATLRFTWNRAHGANEPTLAMAVACPPGSGGGRTPLQPPWARRPGGSSAVGSARRPGLHRRRGLSGTHHSVSRETQLARA